MPSYSAPILVMSIQARYHGNVFKAFLGFRRLESNWSLLNVRGESSPLHQDCWWNMETPPILFLLSSRRPFPSLPQTFCFTLFWWFWHDSVQLHVALIWPSVWPFHLLSVTWWDWHSVALTTKNLTSPLPPVSLAGCHQLFSPYSCSPVKLAAHSLTLLRRRPACTSVNDHASKLNKQPSVVTCFNFSRRLIGHPGEKAGSRQN